MPSLYIRFRRPKTHDVMAQDRDDDADVDLILVMRLSAVRGHSNATIRLPEQEWGCLLVAESNEPVPRHAPIWAGLDIPGSGRVPSCAVLFAVVISQQNPATHLVCSEDVVEAQPWIIA